MSNNLKHKKEKLKPIEALANFIVFDEEAFNQFLATYLQYADARKYRVSNFQSTEDRLKILIQYVQNQHQTTLTFAELKKALSPFGNWERISSLIETFREINAKSTVSLKPSDVALPKEYDAISAAPNKIQGQTSLMYNFIFEINGQKTHVHLTKIAPNIFVTTAHAWQYWIDKNNGEQPKIFSNFYPGQSNEYRVEKVGRPVSDANINPNSIPAEATQDLIILEIDGTDNYKVWPLSSTQPQEKIYSIVYPVRHILTRFGSEHSSSSDEQQLTMMQTHGTMLSKTNGMIVADIFTHTGASGLPALNENGEVIGIIWGSSSFRRNNFKQAFLHKLYFDGTLIVEREYTYIIPIEAVLDFVRK